jgi:hypothetical protein
MRLSDPLRWPLLSRQARAVAEKYSWESYLARVEALLFKFVNPSKQNMHAASQVMPALPTPQKVS